MKNPLLDYDSLPAFNAIKAEHVQPALEHVLSENRQFLKTRLEQKSHKPDWTNLIEPLNEGNNRLEKLWSPVSHLNAVMNSADMRDAYNACLPLLSEYSTEIGQNKALYQLIRQMRDSEQQTLNTAQLKALDDSLLGFQLSGVDLPEDKKQRFREIDQEQSRLSAQFSDNVLDATNHWFKHFTEASALQGLPDSALEMAAAAAQQRELKGWVITLDFPSYFAVMSYADDRILRQNVYQAYTTRASALSEEAQWDNSDVIRDILKLRQEQAELLGYAHYADVSLASKMAESTTEVVTFLRELAVKSKPYAEKEFKALCEFAENQLALTDVQAWDVTYVSEKMRQSLFDFSEEDLKPYFPVDQVIQGLFGLVEKLYQVRIVPHDEVALWHTDVRFYRIYNQDQTLRAEFYLDLYARQNKRGGAWMSDFCGRFKQGNHTQIPVAFMTCNGAPPVGDKPALFTHDEVVTLFHEFGHGLHHMLTLVDYPDIAGINGVEWDAVELPSQFMENWCWEREVIDSMASHWQTGEKLPEALFQKMLAARHFQTAMGTVRQLEFALFDMLLHMDTQAAQENRMDEIMQQVRAEVSVIPAPTFNRMTHSFSHIFAGGYAAGYYSYKWAEVLSADAYARFEEEGLFSEQVGHAFLQEVLQVGGSRPAIESFVAFRGRKPSIDALLRHSGLAEAA